VRAGGRRKWNNDDCLTEFVYRVVGQHHTGASLLISDPVWGQERPSRRLRADGPVRSFRHSSSKLPFGGLLSKVRVPVGGTASGGQRVFRSARSAPRDGSPISSVAWRHGNLESGMRRHRVWTV
jgi:hypothetical protein